MKKTYEAPSVEKIEFRYRDQIVAESGETGGGNNSWNTNPGSTCYKYSPQKNGAHVCEPD